MIINIDESRALEDAELSGSGGRGPVTPVEINGEVIKFSLKQLRIIKYLGALEPDQTAGREELVRLLWPRSPEGNPNRLDQVLGRIRKKSPLLVVRGGRGWRINRHAQLSGDSESSGNRLV